MAYLPITKSYGETTVVSVDNLNAMVFRTGDVQDIWTAGNHLPLQA